MTDIFRHTICLIIDSMMHDGLDEKFWRFYLADDMSGLIYVCKQLLVRAENVTDPRVQQVICDSLSYAIDHPDLFTLISAKGKSAYKKQTPNMVAFSSLLNSIHSFCNQYDLGIIQFVHDQNDEFRGTMREFHKLFFKFEQKETPFGGIPLLDDFAHNIGDFILESSKNSYGLQVVDLFLWLVQRDSQTPALSKTRERLLAKSKDFVISRQMSALIVEARKRQVMSKPMGLRETMHAKAKAAELEKQRLELMGK